MTRRLVFAVDTGGTNTAFGLVDDAGQILAQGSIPTIGYSGLDAYIDALVGQYASLHARVEGEVVGIGIGAPSGNYHTGEIVHAPNLPWQGVIPLARLLADGIGLPARLTNDANAATIGEMYFGVAKGKRDFIMVTLGTGLGSGFVCNGELVYGHDGFAGELGHIIAVRGGRRCGCGRAGCLETYASASGIVRTAHEWLRDRTDETLLRNVDNPISAFAIQEAANRGDAFARELFEYTGKILGECLADAVAITSPEAIVFFGGLAQAGELLLLPTKRHFEENVLHLYRGKVQFLLSGLAGADAALLGAAALIWNTNNGDWIALN